MSNDLGKSFNKLVRDFGILYRGCWIEEKDGGYIYNRTFYATSDALDDAITQNLELLDKSINRERNGKDQKSCGQ